MIERYGIYWVALDPSKGRETKKIRPCVVVSLNSMHVSEMAVVCPLTSTVHPQWAHRLQIRCKGRPAEIMADQIRAANFARFGGRITTLNAKDAQSLRHLLVRLYGTA